MQLLSNGSPNPKTTGSPRIPTSASPSPAGGQGQGQGFGQTAGSLIMAEDAEFMFTPGSVVGCTTCFGTHLEGEVIAFDYQKRVLMLKRPPAGGHPSQNDVHLLNLDYVKDIKIKKEVKREDIPSSSLPHLNMGKVEDRVKDAVDERRCLAKAFEAGVSEEGLKVFLSLKKTLTAPLNVTWDGKNIVVSGVAVAPPYKPDNCAPFIPGGGDGGGGRGGAGRCKPEAINFVRQLLTKYWTDLAKQQQIQAVHDQPKQLPVQQQQQQQQQQQKQQQQQTHQQPPQAAKGGQPVGKPGPQQSKGGQSHQPKNKQQLNSSLNAKNGATSSSIPPENKN